MTELHKHLKSAFKLKNPSPIMQDVLNPNTNEKATDEMKEEIIKSYLKRKFEEEAE